MTIAGQRFGKHVPAATNRRNNSRTVGVRISLRFALSYKREFIRELINSLVREFNHSALVREFGVQMYSVSQRTTEAEEVADS
jgi:hypothetical protein